MTREAEPRPPEVGTQQAGTEERADFTSILLPQASQHSKMWSGRATGKQAMNDCILKAMSVKINLLMQRKLAMLNQPSDVAECD